MKCVGEAAASFGERGVGAGRGKSVGWGGEWAKAGVKLETATTFPELRKSFARENS